MIVISEASSHQTSISKRPKVAASEVPKGDYDRQADEGHHAGLVIGKFAPCPANKNEASYPNTTVPSIAGRNFEPGKEGAVWPSQRWTSIDQKTTGIVKSGSSTRTCHETWRRSVRRDGRGFLGPLAFCDRHVGPPLVRGLHVSFGPFELPNCPDCNASEEHRWPLTQSLRTAIRRPRSAPWRAHPRT